MNEIETDNTIVSLFEIFSVCQKIILNSLDHKNLKLTRTQLFILFALMGKKSLNMSQISTYIASSHEQATRAVAPLAESGLVERFSDESNRKLVLIRLTDAGWEFIKSEKELLKKNFIHHFDTLSEQDVQNLKNSLALTLEILNKIA
jgi:DNA-binding MarR family transcriptional regulator